MGNIYGTLRAANIARQKEWDKGNDITLTYAGNELAGEVAEALEIVLAIVEDRFLRHDKKTALSAELADVVICVDLVANRRGIKTTPEVLAMPEISDADHYGQALKIAGHMAANAGLACNVIKKLERAKFGMVGSRASVDDLGKFLTAALSSAYLLAKTFHINLDQAVSRKFNATSAKNNLITRYDPDLPHPDTTVLTIVTATDWEALYLDDRLTYEGHEVDAANIIDAAKGTFKPISIVSLKADDAFVLVNAGFPSLLAEVKFA